MKTIIARLRAAKYETQGAFARAANLRQPEVSQIENGLMAFGKKRRARVCAALDAPEEMLFNEEGWPKFEPSTTTR